MAEVDAVLRKERPDINIFEIPVSALKAAHGRGWSPENFVSQPHIPLVAVNIGSAFPGGPAFQTHPGSLDGFQYADQLPYNHKDLGSSRGAKLPLALFLAAVVVAGIGYTVFKDSYPEATEMAEIPGNTGASQSTGSNAVEPSTAATDAPQGLSASPPSDGRGPIVSLFDCSFAHDGKNGSIHLLWTLVSADKAEVDVGDQTYPIQLPSGAGSIPVPAGSSGTVTLTLTDVNSDGSTREIRSVALPTSVGSSHYGQPAPDQKDIDSLERRLPSGQGATDGSTAQDTPVITGDSPDAQDSHTGGG